MTNPVVEAAIHAFEQGWAPIPIVKGQKRPAHSDWTETRYKTRQEIESAFESNNLGVLLGDASNGLIDIDLDATESRTLADGFLPVTRMIHGRKSSPKSHYWYRVEGWSVKTTQFFDPVEKDKQAKGENYDKDRLVLVEIRGTGGQTLLPPSTHPDGETYKWHGGFHSPSVVSYKEIEKQVRWLAAASLLARYWPGEGKRHLASMALAGGLLSLGIEELEKDAAAFVQSVALTAGDEEGFEREDDVDSTRKAIAKGRKVRGWPSLAKLIDKRVVSQVIDWLKGEETEEEEKGTLQRTSLMDYMTGDIQPELELVPGILYGGKVTWLQGEPGNGKTIFALWLANKCIEAGYRVMMLDEESGPKMIGERLAGLNANPSLIEEAFFYYPFSGINVIQPEHRVNFNEALDLAKPNLIIFDSVADILSQAGLSENDNDDVTSLVKHFVDPLRNQNVACLFIDHLVKSQMDNGWARGAGQKKSKTDAAWTFTATKPFDKSTIGRVSLKRAKDRLGQLPISHLFSMGGDGQGNILVDPTEVTRSLTAPDDPIVKKIIEYLGEHATTEDSGLKPNEIVEGLDLPSNKKVSEAFRWIKENITETPIEIVELGRNRTLWFYAGELEIDWEAMK